MGRQVSEEEEQQIYLQLGKLWKYRLISRVTWLPRHQSTKRNNFCIKKNLNKKCELILNDLAIQNGEGYSF